MRGFLIKDWKLLQGRLSYFFVVALIGIFFMLTKEEPSFAIGYMTILITIFSMSTISYDEFDNGMSFLMTLPTSRKTYVQEKYLFSFLMTGVTAFICTILGMIIMMVRQGNVGVKDILMIGCANFCVAALIIAIMIPIEIKFGVEKGRTAMGVLGGIVFVAAFGISAIGKKIQFDVTKVIEVLDKSADYIGIVITAVIIVGVAISYVLSARFMEQKEF